jgi:hypothetical protein
VVQSDFCTIFTFQPTLQRYNVVIGQQFRIAADRGDGGETPFLHEIVVLMPVKLNGVDARG